MRDTFQPLFDAIAGAAKQAQHSSDFIDSTIDRGPNLADLCRLFDCVRDAYEQMDEVKTQLGKQVQFLSVTVIPKRFEVEGTGTISLKDINARFTVSTRMSASMVDKPAGMAWLEANGAAALIQPTVNASALSKFASEYVTEQGKDLPREIFKVNTVQHLSRTRV